MDNLQVNQLYTKILKMFTSSEIQPISISVVYSISMSGKNESVLSGSSWTKNLVMISSFQFFWRGGGGWEGESESEQTSRLFRATWPHQQGVRVQIKTLGIVLFFSDRLWFGLIPDPLPLNSTNFSSFSLKHFKF